MNGGAIDMAADAAAGLPVPDVAPAGRGWRDTTYGKFATITFGSAMFVSLKTAMVAAIDHLTIVPPLANYGFVTLSVTLLGWLYHSKVSFDQPLTRRTLWRYLQQAAVLKALDYALYAGLVKVGHLDPWTAVLATGAVVFTTRVVVYLKYVFV